MGLWLGMVGVGRVRLTHWVSPWTRMLCMIGLGVEVGCGVGGTCVSGWVLVEAIFLNLLHFIYSLNMCVSVYVC